MDATRLDQQTLQRPAACVWHDQFAVAWSDSRRNAAVTVALGPVDASGPFQPVILTLPFIARGGDLALASYADRLWLAFLDQNQTLQITSSADGAVFDPPTPLAGYADQGVTLAAASTGLLAAWVATGGKVTVTTGDPNGVFDPPLVLDQASTSTPSLAIVVHPYHGEQVVLAWTELAADQVLLVAGSPKSLATLNARPVSTGIVGPVSVCAGGPPINPAPGLAMACRYSDDAMGLWFTNDDLAVLSENRGEGAYVRTIPALAAIGGDLLFAYVEDLIDYHVWVGSWGPVFGAPSDLQDKVGQPCDPRECTDDARLVCILTNKTELKNQPAQISNARTGDLVLTPADGDGVIGTILKGLKPLQFYDHMGIMIGDYTLIRHCTEAKDRLMHDKTYFTGSLFSSPAPVDGLRPDLVKFGWPGPITQSIQDGLFDGWNSGRNPAWNYHELAQFQQGQLFGQEMPLTQDQQLAFFDLEHPETAVRITNLTWVPTYRSDHPGPLWPVIVRPPRGAEQFRPWVRWALDRVAATAATMSGHYRFYAYTDATIATDASRNAPPKGDPAWQGLPAGADWAAGTPGLVCSSFVWLAARRALAGLVPQLRINFDPHTPVDEAGRTQTSAGGDGLFQYHEDERKSSGQNLHDWIVQTVENTVKQEADKNVPALARIGVGVVVGVLTGLVLGPVAGVVLGALAAGATSPANARDVMVGLTQMPEHVANGVCNAFANDHPEDNTKDANSWQQPGTGLAVSPDDTMLYWDAPGENADFRFGLWGTVEQAMLANPRPELVEVGELELSPGIARVLGAVEFQGHRVVGADVFIGCRKTTTTVDGIFEMNVPASPIDPANGQDQLIRAQSYWDHPIGMLHGQMAVPLAVGLNTLQPLQLDPPPEWRRRVEIHGRLDMLHQVMFGHDTSDHPNVSASVFVQVDPSMAAGDFADAVKAAQSGTFGFYTERCGGERAHFFGIVTMFDPHEPPPPEGPNAVKVVWEYEILDGDDEESERTVDSQNGTIVIAAGQTGRLQPALNDGDEPPDRAQSDILIDNFVNPA